MGEEFLFSEFCDIFCTFWTFYNYRRPILAVFVLNTVRGLTTAQHVCQYIRSATARDSRGFYAIITINIWGNCNNFLT